MGIGQNLKFDVFGPLKIFLQIDGTVTKSGGGFPGSGGTGFLQLFRRIDDPDALAAPPGRGFNHQRVPDFFGNFSQFFGVRFGLRHSGYHRHIALDHDIAGSDFVAQVADDIGRRPDKYQALLLRTFQQIRHFPPEIHTRDEWLRHLVSLAASIILSMFR